MRVPYYNFNHILLIASQDRFTPEGKARIKSFSIHTQDIELYFSDYVKSQVHCNITEDLFKRNRDIYIRLYRGDTQCLDTVKNYFITDIKRFLLCNDSNIKLNLIYDFDSNTNLVDISAVEKIKTEINNILMDQESNKEMLVWLCHNCADLSDVKSKVDNYATAYYLETEMEEHD